MHSRSWLFDGTGIGNWQDLYFIRVTVNFLNIWTPEKFVVITLKLELCGLYPGVMSPNDADGMANGVDPDPRGAV